MYISRYQKSTTVLHWQLYKTPTFFFIATVRILSTFATAYCWNAFTTDIYWPIHHTRHGPQQTNSKVPEFNCIHSRHIIIVYNNERHPKIYGNLNNNCNINPGISDHLLNIQERKLINTIDMCKSSTARPWYQEHDLDLGINPFFSVHPCNLMTHIYRLNNFQ